MTLDISKPELLKRYGITNFDQLTKKKNFTELVIEAHGRSSSRYGIKAVDSWERNSGLLESLEIEPLITPHK